MQQSNAIGLPEPQLIVAMGATAGAALLNRPVRVTRERGIIVEHAGQRILPTVHPSYLLRLGDKIAAARASAQFVDDLGQARAWL